MKESAEVRLHDGGGVVSIDAEIYGGGDDEEAYEVLVGAVSVIRAALLSQPGSIDNLDAALIDAPLNGHTGSFSARGEVQLPSGGTLHFTLTARLKKRPPRASSIQQMIEVAAVDAAAAVEAWAEQSIALAEPA